MRTMMIVVLALTLVAVGCGTPGGGTLSPSQPSSSSAAGGFGAQNIGGDQGQGQTPQTTPGGQASQVWHFAALMPFETLAEILNAAKEGQWTAETTLAAIKAASGAPQNVSITTGAMTVQGGSASATGATSGTGGGTAGSGAGPVSNE